MLPTCSVGESAFYAADKFGQRITSNFDNVGEVCIAVSAYYNLGVQYLDAYMCYLTESPGAAWVLKGCEPVVPSMFDISAADGALVAFAIVGCWLVGFGIRMVIRAMDVAPSGQDKSDD